MAIKFLKKQSAIHKSAKKQAQK